MPSSLSLCPIHRRRKMLKDGGAIYIICTQNFDHAQFCSNYAHSGTNAAIETGFLAVKQAVSQGERTL